MLMLLVDIVFFSHYSRQLLANIVIVYVGVKQHSISHRPL